MLIAHRLDFYATAIVNYKPPWSTSEKWTFGNRVPSNDRNIINGTKNIVKIW